MNNWYNIEKLTAVGEVMETDNYLKHKFEDISDDLLYISELINEKSQDSVQDLTYEINKLKEVINEIESVSNILY